MSSSLYLKRRDQDFGPWYDHYVSPWAECHPNYAAIPLRKPDGVKVCIKVANTVAHNTPITAYRRVSDAVNMYGHPSETRIYNDIPREDRVVPIEVRKYIRESPISMKKGLGI